MNQDNYQNYEDENTVEAALTLREVEKVRAMAAVQGLGHLAVFRPEVRAEVLRRFGLSPKVRQLRKLWADDWDIAWEWLDVGNLAHASVVEVECGAAGDTYLGFTFSSELSGLGARLAWSVLVNSDDKWSRFTDLCVGIPELHGHTAGSEVADDLLGLKHVSVVPRVSVAGGAVEPEEAAAVGAHAAVEQPRVAEHVQRVLQKFDLESLAACEYPEDALELPVLDSGFCYLLLFHSSVRVEVGARLGPSPRLDVVLELYLAALVFRFHSSVALRLVGGPGLLHAEVFPGDWRENLVCVSEAVARSRDVRIGGERGGRKVNWIDVAKRGGPPAPDSLVAVVKADFVAMVLELRVLWGGELFGHERRACLVSHRKYRQGAYALGYLNVLSLHESQGMMFEEADLYAPDDTLDAYWLKFAMSRTRSLNVVTPAGLDEVEKAVAHVGFSGGGSRFDTKAQAFLGGLRETHRHVTKGSWGDIPGAGCYTAVLRLVYEDWLVHRPVGGLKPVVFTVLEQEVVFREFGVRPDVVTDRDDDLLDRSSVVVYCAMSDLWERLEGLYSLVRVLMLVGTAGVRFVLPESQLQNVTRVITGACFRDATSDGELETIISTV